MNNELKEIKIELKQEGCTASTTVGILNKNPNKSEDTESENEESHIMFGS